MKAALMVSLATMRTWLLVVLVVALGGIAFACSSGDDDADVTGTPTDSRDTAIDTPTDGTAPDGSPATLDPGATLAPGGTANGSDDEPGGPPPTSARPTPATDGVMRLTVLDGGSCDVNECFVNAGATFTLAVEVVRAPALNYVLLQTYIEYGVYDPNASEDSGGPGSCGDGVGNGDDDGVDRLDEDCVTVDLVYVPSEAAQDELVWGDLSSGTALRGNTGLGTLLHGGLTGLVPPLPTSNETGVVVRLQMMCPSNPVDVPVSLLPYDNELNTSGSLFVVDGGLTQIIPSLSGITIHCQ